MNLKINDKRIICHLDEFPIGDDIDDELILYSENTDRIFVFNCTSSFIYKLLRDLAEDDEITDAEIVERVFSEFSVEDIQKDDVIDEIRDVLEMFLTEGVLIPENDLSE